MFALIERVLCRATKWVRLRVIGSGVLDQLSLIEFNKIKGLRITIKAIGANTLLLLLAVLKAAEVVVLRKSFRADASSGAWTRRVASRPLKWWSRARNRKISPDQIH